MKDLNQKIIKLKSDADNIRAKSAVKDLKKKMKMRKAKAKIVKCQAGRLKRQVNRAKRKSDRNTTKSIKKFGQKTARKTLKEIQDKCA